MATKTISGQIKRGVQNVDDILYLATGRRLREVVARGIDMFSGPKEPELSPDNPYVILGIHPDAMDVVVRAAYRALAREYHPDTGAKPDPAKFQAATEAYKTIMADRRKKE